MKNRKFDFERVDLPGRDVYRCRRTGQVLGDGSPFTPAEFVRLGNVVEPTREPELELPESLGKRLEAAESTFRAADAAYQRASEAFWRARDERDRRYSEWGHSLASVNGAPPVELKAADDEALEAKRRLEDASELRREARATLTDLELQADRWRRLEKARLEKIERPAPTLGERIGDLDARA